MHAFARTPMARKESRQIVIHHAMEMPIKFVADHGRILYIRLHLVKDFLNIKKRN
jgi:hypothetical protein